MAFTSNDDTPEDLKCSICLESFDTPTEISPCKHVFCLKCVDRLHPQQCPECRKPIRGKVNAHNIIKNLADLVQGTCTEPLVASGGRPCNWSGTMAEFRQHRRDVAHQHFCATRSTSSGPRPRSARRGPRPPAPTYRTPPGVDAVNVAQRAASEGRAEVPGTGVTNSRSVSKLTYVAIMAINAMIFMAAGVYYQLEPFTRRPKDGSGIFLLVGLNLALYHLTMKQLRRVAAFLCWIFSSFFLVKVAPHLVHHVLHEPWTRMDSYGLIIVLMVTICWLISGVLLVWDSFMLEGQ